MNSLSRREFVKAGFGLAGASQIDYESPVVISVDLSALDYIDPNAASFESVTSDIHVLNAFRLNADNSYWAHIYQDTHNMQIEAKEYWDNQILQMVQDGNCYLGEYMAGSPPTCRMLLGYSKYLSDGTQLWALVVKVSREINDAGRNFSPWGWLGGVGFTPLDRSSMALRELVYEKVRNSVYKGALRLDVPIFEGDNFSLVGIFWALGEINSCWEGGGSADPSIFMQFQERYDERFADEVPNAKNTYDLALCYMREYERGILPNLREGEEQLIACFKAGITYEEWERAFEDYSYNIVS